MADTSRISRIALIAAAVLVLVAGGAALWRNRPVPPQSAPVAPAGSPAELIATLEARLKSNPGDAEGWRTLGWSFFQTGRYGESATAYARAAQLAPQIAENWSSLGEALTLAGKEGVPPDAQDAFRSALERDPKDPRARYFLAVAKDVAGDHRAAIDGWFALLADTPPGAPWEQDIRRVITDVAAREKIDVAPRFAALRRAPGGPAGAAVAGPTAEQMRAASALPPGQQQAMVTQMVEGLAAKLERNPRNVDGWIMLMRSRVQLGQQRQAGEALARARAANPGAASSLDAAAAELGLSP